MSSPERLEIFGVVSSLEDTFTIKDVYYRLHQQGFKVRITTVQTLLKGLSNRGYLKHFDLKLGSSRAVRQFIFKELNPGLNFLCIANVTYNDHWSYINYAQLFCSSLEIRFFYAR